MEKFRNDRLHFIGEGAETVVYSMQKLRDGKERSIVLKTYEDFEHDERPEMIADKNGFNDLIKEELEGKYKLLKKAFGPYIPQLRMIKNSDYTNAEDERYFAVQTKIDLPKEPDIFGFSPSDFEHDENISNEENEMSARTREQLLDIARRLKEQCVQFESENPGDAIIIDIDFGKNNLVLDKEGNLHYVDITANTAVNPNSWNRDTYKERVQYLEILAGKSEEELESDPFYTSAAH